MPAPSAPGAQDAQGDHHHHHHLGDHQVALGAHQVHPRRRHPSQGVAHLTRCYNDHGQGSSLRDFICVKYLTL